MENYNDIPEVETEVVSNSDYEVVEETPVEKGKGFAIAGLVLSILGLLPCSFLCCAYFYFIPNLIFSVLGLIFALVYRSKNNKKLSGMAKAALIMSIIGLVLAVLVAIIFIVLLALGFASEFMNGMSSSFPSVVADPNYYY